MGDEVGCLDHNKVGGICVPCFIGELYFMENDSLCSLCNFGMAREALRSKN